MTTKNKYTDEEKVEILEGFIRTLEKEGFSEVPIGEYSALLMHSLYKLEESE